MSDKDSVELRKRIVEILGLETDPDGQPNMLLTRDENGQIIEGADYSEEVGQLVALTAAQVAAALRSIGEPKFNDIAGIPKPSEYQWSLQIIDWYRKRIAALTPEQKGIDPVPPNDCTCGALWTVRGKHGKLDCPYLVKQKERES